MLLIETDGTVTYREARIGTVVLDNPARDAPKIGGLLRECPQDEITRLEAEIASHWNTQGIHDINGAEDTIDTIETILDGDLDDPAKLAAIIKAMP